MANINENPNVENIKCVLVGDNNVGKTRLVCARAFHRYGPHRTFLPYGGKHVPTIWANDHYRYEAQTLKNAQDCVDGVDVSLRLWDTFGDHNKDRRFCYGRADVVLMCFSVCDVKSLQHILNFWLPEVRKHCKFIPILLVACKVDLRFADLDELNRKKNTLAKKIQKSDILFPEICRKTAADIACPYYETSLYCGYGVQELFQNVIRAALSFRRKMYLYRKPSLKHIRRPLPYAPLSPPKPDPPQLTATVSEPRLDFSWLLNNSLLSDLVIVCQNSKFFAHKAILASASTILNSFLSIRRRESSGICVKKTNINAVNDIFVVDVKELEMMPGKDEEEEVPPGLLDVKKENGDPDIMTGCESIPPPSYEESFSRFEFVQSYITASLADDRPTDILYLKPSISYFSMLNILQFCYEGRLNPDYTSPDWLKQNIHLFSELFIASQQMGVSELPDILTKLLNGDTASSFTLQCKFLESRKSTIKEILLFKSLYSDVTFKTDDGIIPGHRPFLVCGCDMMNAMFSGTYVESVNNEIDLPGTTVRSLQAIFEYIYTRNTPSLKDCDFNDVIALADRLCLPDLIALLEESIIKQLTVSSMTNDSQYFELVARTLENSQLHNAQRLYEWCLYYLSTNYNEACKKCRISKSLSPSNQKILECRRWPPVWYIKDQDNYEKALVQRENEDKTGKGKNKSSRR